jgi:DNA-binding protein Fis
MRIKGSMQTETKQGTYYKHLAAFEKNFFEVVLRTHRGNILKAAEEMGINRNTLKSRVDIYGIKIKDIRRGKHLN